MREQRLVVVAIFVTTYGKLYACSADGVKRFHKRPSAILPQFHLAEAPYAATRSHSRTPWLSLLGLADRDMVPGASYPNADRCDLPWHATFSGRTGHHSVSLCITIAVGIAAALAGGDDNAADSPQGSASARVASVPTDTPKPVPTPTIECPTPTGRAYINSVVEVFTPMGTAYGEFGRLNIEASDNPVLIFDDSWKLEVVLQLALIEIAAEEITELTPPPS